jgi:hypothetical protein
VPTTWPVAQDGRRPAGTGPDPRAPLDPCRMHAAGGAGVQASDPRHLHRAGQGRTTTTARSGSAFSGSVRTKTRVSSGPWLALAHQQR